MFQNESWCVTGRCSQEEQLVLVRGEAEARLCLSFHGSMLSVELHLGGGKQATPGKFQCLDVTLRGVHFCSNNCM